MYAAFILSTFLGPLYGENTQSSWIEFWNSVFKKRIFFVQINQDRKIDQIIGKRERIASKKQKVFVWDNAWAMDDVQIRNPTSQYHQNFYTCSTHFLHQLLKLNAPSAWWQALGQENGLVNENLGACRICKYRLFECDFLKIRKWRVASRLLWSFTYVYC